MTEKHASPSRLAEREGGSLTCNVLAGVGPVVIALEAELSKLGAFGKAPQRLEYAHVYENGKVAAWTRATAIAGVALRVLIAG